MVNVLFHVCSIQLHSLWMYFHISCFYSSPWWRLKSRPYTCWQCFISLSSDGCRQGGMNLAVELNEYLNALSLNDSCVHVSKQQDSVGHAVAVHEWRLHSQRWSWTQADRNQRASSKPRLRHTHTHWLQSLWQCVRLSPSVNIHLTGDTAPDSDHSPDDERCYNRALMSQPVRTQWQVNVLKDCCHGGSWLLKDAFITSTALHIIPHVT